MKDILEFKSITAEVKDIDTKSRVITGYLSNFGNKDYDNDIIEKGAFKKSITERGGNIFFLNQHNWSQPHGKFAELEEDSKGLRFVSNPLPNTSYSNDALELYSSGIVKEHSIGFNTLKSDYDKKEQVRYIREVKLYEGSNVTLGANPETPFTGFKSMTLTQANDQVKSIVKLLKDGTLTDDTFAILEIALKQLQKQMYDLGKKSLDNNKEPLVDNTQKNNEPNQDQLISTLNNFKF